MSSVSTLLSLIDSTIDFVNEYDFNDNHDEQKENTNEIEEEQIFQLLISSFGYKFGALKTTDLNYNVRSVENPSVKLRKNQTGLQKRFRKEFFQIASVIEYYDIVRKKITGEIEKCIQNNNKENNNDDEYDLFVGIGCEFGKHRSVSFVEKLKEDMHKSTLDNYPRYMILVETQHRDVDKEQNQNKRSKGKNNRRR